MVPLGQFEHATTCCGAASNAAGASRTGPRTVSGGQALAPDTTGARGGRPGPGSKRLHRLRVSRSPRNDSSPSGRLCRPNSSALFTTRRRSPVRSRDVRLADASLALVLSEDVAIAVGIGPIDMLGRVTGPNSMTFPFMGSGRGEARLELTEAYLTTSLPIAPEIGAELAARLTLLASNSGSPDLDEVIIPYRRWWTASGNDGCDHRVPPLGRRAGQQDPRDARIVALAN